MPTATQNSPNTWIEFVKTTTPTIESGKNSKSSRRIKENVISPKNVIMSKLK